MELLSPNPHNIPDRILGLRDTLKHAEDCQLLLEEFTQSSADLMRIMGLTDHYDPVTLRRVRNRHLDCLSQSQNLTAEIKAAIRRATGDFSANRAVSVSWAQINAFRTRVNQIIEKKREYVILLGLLFKWMQETPETRGEHIWRCSSKIRFANNV